MLASDLEPTKQSFGYYDECAPESGYRAGTQHHGSLWKVHFDETGKLADEVGALELEGPSTPFLEGDQGNERRFLGNLLGLTSRTGVPSTVTGFAAAVARGRTAATVEESRTASVSARDFEPEARLAVTPLMMPNRPCGSDYQQLARLPEGAPAPPRPETQYGTARNTEFFEALAQDTAQAQIVQESYHSQGYSGILLNSEERRIRAMHKGIDDYIYGPDR